MCLGLIFRVISRILSRGVWWRGNWDVAPRFLHSSKRIPRIPPLRITAPAKCQPFCNARRAIGCVEMSRGIRGALKQKRPPKGLACWKDLLVELQVLGVGAYCSRRRSSQFSSRPFMKPLFCLVRLSRRRAWSPVGRRQTLASTGQVDAAAHDEESQDSHHDQLRRRHRQEHVTNADDHNEHADDHVARRHVNAMVPMPVRWQIWDLQHAAAAPTGPTVSVRVQRGA